MLFKYQPMWRLTKNRINYHDKWEYNAKLCIKGNARVCEADHDIYGAFSPCIQRNIVYLKSLSKQQVMMLFEQQTDANMVYLGTPKAFINAMQVLCFRTQIINKLTWSRGRTKNVPPPLDSTTTARNLGFTAQRLPPSVEWLDNRIAS